MTKEESHLWYDYLREYPIRFLRQKVIDNFIVDFYCPKAKIAIELDGSQHFEEEMIKKDKIRTEIIEKREIKVIRIANDEIWKSFREVCEYIDLLVKESVGIEELPYK